MVGVILGPEVENVYPTWRRLQKTKICFDFGRMQLFEDEKGGRFPHLNCSTNEHGF